MRTVASPPLPAVFPTELEEPPDELGLTDLAAATPRAPRFEPVLAPDEVPNLVDLCPVVSIRFGLADRLVSWRRIDIVLPGSRRPRRPGFLTFLGFFSATRTAGLFAEVFPKR
jgi:hypothetical protein